MEFRPRIVMFLIAVFVHSLVPSAFVLSQTAGTEVQKPPDQGKHLFTRILDTYRDKPVAPVNLENSPRIESLIVGGKLELTLSDALALALENNLDIAVQRFVPSYSQTDLLRSQAGQSPRGFTGASR